MTKHDAGVEEIETESGRKMYGLNPKKHGMGGILLRKPKPKKQDRRFKSETYYVVAFFPKITGIGPAWLMHHNAVATLSCSPEAAITKFMDGIKPGEEWATYENAGWRVRRIRIADLGDPE